MRSSICTQFCFLNEDLVDHLIGSSFIVIFVISIVPYYLLFACLLVYLLVVCCFLFCRWIWYSFLLEVNKIKMTLIIYLKYYCDTRVYINFPKFKLASCPRLRQTCSPPLQSPIFFSFQKLQNACKSNRLCRVPDHW